MTSPAFAAPQESGNNEIIFMALDLASLASVRAFATAFLSSEPRLDILIHNAGEGQQDLPGGGGWATVPSSQVLPEGQCVRGKDAPYHCLTDGDTEAFGDPCSAVAHIKPLPQGSVPVAGPTSRLTCCCE